MKRPHFLLFTLLLLSFALYLPSLSAEFVWDARAQILIDTYIHTPGHWLDLVSLRALSQDILDNNRPLHLLLLILDARIWGKDPFGFHLTSILLHTGCAGLVFLFCRRLTNATGAFLAALLFAVHPINCEAVAEVSYREDLLACFFVALGLLLATYFKPEKTARFTILGIACGLSFFLAATAKESGAAGPFILASYWFLFRRHESRGGWSALLISTFALVGLFLAARFWMAPQASTIFTQKAAYLGGSFPNALTVIPRIWAAYLARIFLPYGLCADYGPFSVRILDLPLSLVLLCVVVGAQSYLSKRSSLFALGALIFWLSLLPVSNFIPIYRPMADRFLYLPMFGTAVMLAPLLGAERLKRPLAVILILSCCALAFLTWQQQKIWKNSLALWSDTLAKNPYSVSAAINLGGALIQASRYEEALESLQKAVKLSNSAETYANLALALDGLGRTREAGAAAQKAAALDSRYSDPQKLVKALLWEPELASRLQSILSRKHDL